MLEPRLKHSKLAHVKSKPRSQSLDPAEIIGSIFTARRDLVPGVKMVARGTGFTVEELDLLICLYGARELAWDDLSKDEEGYVAFQELEDYLVHNPSLLSRRLRKMANSKPPVVEVAGVDPKKSGLHFNSQRVRITAEGIKRTKPVWERYRQMSANVLKDISQDLLKAHFAVNEEISARIRARRKAALDWATELD